MKCVKCGYDNVRGTRFCENCGTRIVVKDPEVTELLDNDTGSRRKPQRICPRCGSLVDGNTGVCMMCGYDLNAAAARRVASEKVYREEPEKGGLLKMILLGVVIGLAILGIVFGAMYVINNGGDEGETTDEATVPIETQPQTQPVDDSQDGVDYQTETYDRNDSSGGEDYSLYIDEPETRLYSSNVPIFFPDSDSRLLSDQDIKDLSDNQIQKVVNDIYARNGYDFNNNNFKSYYRGFSWYSPDTKDMDVIKSRMTDYEKRNVEYLTKQVR